MYHEKTTTRDFDCKTDHLSLDLEPILKHVKQRHHDMKQLVLQQVVSCHCGQQGRGPAQEIAKDLFQFTTWQNLILLNKGSRHMHNRPRSLMPKIIHNSDFVGSKTISSKYVSEKDW